MAPKNPSRKGFEILHDPVVNKSTAFTPEERELYGLHGLLPARPSTMAHQQDRVLQNLRRKDHDIERYIFLLALQSRNERLFYRTLIDNVDELLPIVYTPTVGQACKEFAHIFRQPRGFYVTPQDRGQIRRILDNWPERDVRAIVVTDGERILGLGDLGANGMGIPIGKLSLYTAFAGINPDQCLPVMLDVGTDNEEFLNDALYLGIQSRRLRGDAYFELVEEFVEAVVDAFPRTLLQFEDFATPNAYELLRRYRDRLLCFNDDIQGTAAVILAGVRAAVRITHMEFRDMRVMFLGAGSAATGIADLMVRALVAEGLSEDDAHGRLWFVDASGLVVKSRTDLMEHNLPYAHDHAPADFQTAVETIRPHALIGATGHPGTFTQPIVSAMAAINRRPIVFALSNPTSRAECTPEQAYEWSDGRAIFASGSPFDAVALKDGTTIRPGQGNNAYIFPGVALGAIGCGAEKVTEEMFLESARVLAEGVTSEALAEGTVYPPLDGIRELSLEIATAVAEKAYDQGLAREPRPNSVREHLAALMYDPSY